jgi:aminoglycoside phosphotransferase (APT) family kinase protein
MAAADASMPDKRSATRAARTIDTDESRDRLSSFIAAAAGATAVELRALRKLSGGAIQENWALDVAIGDGPWQGEHAWVLRTDAVSSVAGSLSRAQEFAILQAACAVRVLAPQPLWVCSDPEVIGRAFFVMRRLPGIAAGHRLARDDALVPNRERLALQLGANLARVHSLAPPHPGLPFLREPPKGPALHQIEAARDRLDRLPTAHPAIEWGLRWCERNRPRDERVTLVHGDYRTGNYLVDRGELVGVLDWEFAAWGNPMSDIGWFFARCWRFGRDELRAGGVGHAEDFLTGYEATSGGRVDRSELHFWEVMAHLRWALIALQQAQRHRSGEERSLELALTGRMVSALELEALALAWNARS